MTRVQCRTTPTVGELNIIFIEVQENQSSKIESLLSPLENIDWSISFDTLSEPIEFKHPELTGLFKPWVILMQSRRTLRICKVK